MNLIAPPRQFDPAQPEWMDRHDIEPAMLRHEAAALEKVNRQLLGQRMVVTYVRKIARAHQLKSLNILDLGTGAGDIPRAIVAWGRKSGLTVKATAVDGNPEIARFAREQCAPYPEIAVEDQNMTALPYPPQSFDIVLCSLALHHLTRADAVSVLRRMQELARLGYLVNDLRRSWMTIWSSKVITRALTRSEIVRNDAPQSFRAAFTVRELEAMGREAGLRDFSVRRKQGGYRMVLAGNSA